MRRTPQECHTLQEYREQVLRLSQRELGTLAKCKQAWISAVERGHLPRPKNWSRLLKAYGLQGEEGETEFERMILNAQKLKALRTPAAEDFPLGQFATGAAQVVPLPAGYPLLAEAPKAVNQ